MKRQIILATGLFMGLVVLLGLARSAEACGGLFCQNSPVDQNAERIIFTDNGDGTISAIIQIQYTGSAPDFSWILPLPNPISDEDIAVPETGSEAFLELEQLTNPRIIPPPVPDDCADIEFELSAEEDAGVDVFASGEVGPFGYDVIGSEDPDALIIWLRDNEYRVTEEMEPLINVYVEEQFVFLAMRLLPDQGVQEIKPVKITYESDRPMIPLRLTAVAANPDMAVLTWFFSDAQAVPVNYAHMEIPDEELRIFWPFGGNNYRSLIGQAADRHDGQAFLTEYAGPSSALAFTDPLLVELAAKHSYLTRLNTVISPEEMTVDPVFDFEAGRADVSNVRDLSSVDKDLYICDRLESSVSSEESDSDSGGIINLPFVGGGDEDGSAADEESGGLRRLVVAGVIIGGLGLGSVAGLLGLGLFLRRRSS